MSSYLLSLLSFGIICTLTSGAQSAHYEPNWKSLDKRPIPTWYDEAKFGIFIHWGVFSVPGFETEWFWYRWQHDKRAAFVDFMKKNYPPNFTYADFASSFTAEFYDPDHWADIIEAAGAKYVVLTSKHHEGFTNWPSKVSFNWNAMEVGPKRDLVGDLATAIRKKKDIKFGLYHSLFEWFNPLFLEDAHNKFKTRYFAETKSIPELYEIVTSYKPDVIWSDGSGGANYTYWEAPEFIAWLYNESPVKDTVVVNDRWGDVMCKHGDFYTCSDRYNPGHLVKHKWENAMTIDKGSWGYRRDASLSTYLSIEDLVHTLVETISCGGNLLMNIGPTHDGRIIPVFEERLRQVGSWLHINGEAIYASVPWTHQNDTVTKNIWYTSKINTANSTDVYAIALEWPEGDLRLGAPVASATTTVTLLGYPQPIKYTGTSAGGMILNIPVIPFNQMPCQWAWVFKLTGLKNM